MILLNELIRIDIIEERPLNSVGGRQIGVGVPPDLAISAAHTDVEHRTGIGDRNPPDLEAEPFGPDDSLFGYDFAAGVGDHLDEPFPLIAYQRHRRRDRQLC